ncbi:hypothetical protein JOC78_000828 [Bacillus ectoiniformans]|nr:hypothetical protein [Bacillus ectoiniformans]
MSLLLMVSIVIYYRYWPVSVQKIKVDEASGFPVIDVRDYQDISHLPVEEAIQIPCSYIPRYAPAIETKEVFIAAGNNIECNFAVRRLKRLGIQVKGCICLNSSC